MAATSSRILALGTPLPPIVLYNAVDGKKTDVAQLAIGKRGTVVMVICNHCPYFVHIRAELVRAAHEAMDKDLAVVAVNPNDVVAYPADSPEEMSRLARSERWRFPFLFDETQDVARALGAECTPDLYVFDAQGKLAYHGQFDDSRPSNGKAVTGKDLRSAIAAVAEGTTPATDQKPSIGCNVKWRAK
jgi:Redoxin